MRRMFLIPTILGLLILFILVIPAWADKPSGTGSPLPEDISLLPLPGVDAGSETPAPALAVPQVSELFVGDFIDTLPLFSLDLSPLTPQVRVELAVGESVLGLYSLDGLGVMLSWQ